MSDPREEAEASAAPDFLDRLIARHAAPAAVPRPGVVRVRPRLPGPFERVEAVRAGAPEPDGAGPLWPASTPSALVQRDAPRPAAAAEARLRTERERTVVHTERTPAEPELRPAPPTGPQTPLLRPVAQLAPGPRPAPDTAQRTARGRADRDPSQPAAFAPTPSGTDAVPAAVSAALRPSAADTAAARDAVRQAAARRSGRAPEQVVQVQIGRLEVTASSPAGGGGAGRRTEAAGRAGATVSLAEYLTRGRE